MSVARYLWTGLRLVAAAVAYLVGLTLSYGLVVPAPPPNPGVEPIPAGLAVLLLSGLSTAVMGWLILRSRRAGWSLVATMIVVFYGVQTFMPQIDSLIFQAYPAFASHLPAAILPRLFLAGLLHACLWVPLAVVILGRWRPDARCAVPAPVAAPLRDWAWMLPVAAAAYVVVYFTFGYYVAWRSPAVRAYYQGTDPGTFWQQMRHVLRDTPWLPAVQAIRGLVWTGLALLVVRTIDGSTVEKALAVGTLFAVVMNAGLLLPNPYMPFEVRMAHLVETASSNFLFGALLGGMLERTAIRYS